MEEKNKLIGQNSSSEYFSEIEFCPTKSGHQTIRVKHEGKNVFLHSKYDPITEAERWTSKLNPKFNYIVIGFGLGYHIEKLAEHIDPDKKIVVVEPDSNLLEQVSKIQSLEGLFENSSVEIMKEYSLSNILNKLKGLIQSEIKNNVKIIYTPSFGKVYHQQILEIKEREKGLLEAVKVNRNTILFFHNKWQTNFFKNLRLTVDSHGVKGLFGQFKGKPIFVVAAGPSLDKNVKLLKQVKDKALVICVGTALKTMLKYDILPDLVISFDGSERNFEHFRDVDVDVPLIFEPLIYHQIPKKYSGPLLTMTMKTNGYMKWFENKLGFTKGEVFPGPSIANLNFDLAYYLGGDPIVFVGQDLAYTEDGQTHSTGTFFNENEDNTKTFELRKIIRVKGIHGGMVPTDYSLDSFRKWFEERIGMIDEKRKFINATEGGAHIEGTEVMPLQRVIDQFCQKSINTTEIIQSYLNNSQEDRISYERLYELFDQIEENLDPIKISAQDGVEHSKKLKDVYRNKTINQNKVGKLLKKLDKVDRKIKGIREYATFIELSLQPIYLAVLAGHLSEPQPGETEHEKGLRVASQSFHLYQGIVKACEHIQKLIEEAREDFQK